MTNNNDFLNNLISMLFHKAGNPQANNSITNARGGVMTGNPSDMRLTYASESPQPSASPIQVAQQMVQGNSQPQGEFKYQMGLSDYSKFKPQIDSILANTPLAQYSDQFIQAANQHKIDPRVLVTIANNESSLGKNYPQDSYNPFGYNAGGAGNVTGPDGKSYVNVDQGLKNAGFTSLPMAIDRLTGRFERQPTEGYKSFYQNPTVSNLQQAYNANPAERDNYIKNAQALIQRFQQGGQ